MLVTLLRFLLGWLFTLVMSIIACLGLLFGPLGAKAAWLMFCRAWAVWALRIVKVHIEIVWREDLFGPAVLVSNNQALIDVVFLPAIFPKRVKWVAKRELLKVPFWGWAFSGGAVFNDPKDPRSAAERIERGIAGLPTDWSI